MTGDIGRIGEDKVCEKLESEGYDILVRNYAVHNVGELDIVARKGSDIFVVEVKARSAKNAVYGAPESFITRSKLGKIRKTIQRLVVDFKLYDMNIVIVAGSVLHDGMGNVVSIELVEI